MAGDDPGHLPLALRYVDVDLYRLTTRVLTDVSWQVTFGDRWAVLGPNGSGKTTLIQLASGYLHPTRGCVEVLGHRLGHVDVRRLREQIATVSAGVSRMIVPRLTAREVVVSAGRGPSNRGGTPTARPSGRRPTGCWPPPASTRSRSAPSECCQRENGSRSCWHAP